MLGRFQRSGVKLASQGLRLIALYFCVMTGLVLGDLSQTKQVEIRTTLGIIVVELDPVSSPLTCAAFLSHIEQHVYDESSFHQKDETDIQGGKPGPHAEGFSGNGNFSFHAPAGEFDLKHVRGAVGLARTVGDCNPKKLSNSTQFYIMWKDNPKSDGQYSIFGHVIKGMDVVDKIADALGKDKTTPIRFDVVAL